MKNIFLLSFFVLPVFLFSQENADLEDYSKVLKNNIDYSKSSTVVWSEDFSNGFPLGWKSVSNNTGSGNNGSSNPSNFAECPWKYTTQGSWGYWNSQPKDGNNNPTIPSAPINSTTASNGFLISDIDSANHWNGGGGTGTTSGSSSGSTYHFIESYFVTSSISTLGYPNVSLEFEHTFRLNNSVNLIVSISRDSVSWTDFFVQGNAQNNTQSADPELLSLNISSIAGNQPMVYVKIGWTARVYYWMIDDMRIVETPRNKIELVEANYGGWFTTPLSNGSGLDYTYFPLNQAMVNGYKIEGVVANLGSQNQNAKLNIEVNDALGTSVHSFTTQSTSMQPLDTVTFVDSSFYPSNIGLYDFTIWSDSDSASTDSIQMQGVITENIYGRDDGNQYSAYGLGRPCGEMVLGTYFDVFISDIVSSISVYITDTSDIGSWVRAELYEIDANNDKIYLTQSSDYILQSSDTGSWITIPLDQNWSLSPGKYMAAVRGEMHPVLSNSVGMSSLARPTTNYIQKNGCLNTGQTYGNWYWLSRVPMIRMNMLITTNIYENEFEGNISIYPNPISDNITLDLIGVKNGIYKIEIFDLLGKKILNKSIYVGGEAQEEIETEKLNKGVYYIIISNEKYSFSEKIIKR